MRNTLLAVLFAVTAAACGGETSTNPFAGQAAAENSGLPTMGAGGPAAPAPQAPVAGQPAFGTAGGPSQTPVSAPAQSASQILAQGAAGALTGDNAMAFYEATVFSLNQVGAGHMAAQLPADQFIQVVAQAFPSAQPEAQQALVNARAIWTQVQANWASASMNDKRQFVYGVLELAIGPQQAAQLTGMNQSGGHGGGTSTGGLSTEVANPAGSCWASAGCESYDPQAGYTYEAPMDY